jgi:methylated-DNA-[protein]-cysteine S-methyltransferase
MPKEFTKRVLEIVKQIPRGKTMSYGEVALQAGNSKAARAVGMIMSKNWDLEIPCHRVVKADGTIGGYNRGLENKLKLLQK